MPRNAIAIGVCFLFYLLLHVMGLFRSVQKTQANALLFLLIGTVGLLGVFKMSQPFTKIKAFFAVTSAAGFYAAIALCLWLQDHLLHLDILHLAVPTFTTLLFFVLLAILAVLTEQILSRTVFRRKKRRCSCFQIDGDQEIRDIIKSVKGKTLHKLYSVLENYSPRCKIPAIRTSSRVRNRTAAMKTPLLRRRRVKEIQGVTPPFIGYKRRTFSC